MGIAEFLSNIRTVLGLSNFAISIAAIMIVTFWILIKFINYVVNRIDIKDDKQFDVLYKIIEDNSFMERLNNQPYLFKQLFYKRFYLLQNYKVEEIEFLISQPRLDLNLHDLNNLKSGGILKFEGGYYIETNNKVTSYWANSYRRFNISIVIGFTLWILISAFFNIILLENTMWFYISIIPLLILETYFLVKVEVVKSYLKSQTYFDNFIMKSIEYRDTHDT